MDFLTEMAYSTFFMRNVQVLWALNVLTLFLWRIFLIGALRGSILQRQFSAFHRDGTAIVITSHQGWRKNNWWSGYWIERNSWYYQRETKIKNSLYWSYWELPSLATTNVQWFCVLLFSLVTTPKMKRNSCNPHIADFNIHHHYLPIIGMCSTRFCMTILSKDVYSMVPDCAHGQNKNIMGIFCKTTTWE